MWPASFEQRLASWNQLRTQCQSGSLESVLYAINNWWFDAPWRAYHLHWDDRSTWPDPWQLLDDNVFCSLARGLGILYTITMLDRPEIQDAELVDAGTDNLVFVCREKYILNWDRRRVLNINLASFDSLHRISQQQIKKQLQ